MELSEFVKTVLIDIVSGIQEAQADPATENFIVRKGDGGHQYANHPRFSSSGRLKSTIVDFDIAVTVEEGSKASGGGGIKVAGIGASGDLVTSSRDIKVSHIQFAVPIMLPEID